MGQYVYTYPIWPLRRLLVIALVLLLMGGCTRPAPTATAIPPGASARASATASPVGTASPPAAAAPAGPTIVAAAPAVSPSPTPRPVEPTAISTSARSGPGVILLSIDGAGADVIASYSAAGVMPNLARLAQMGAVVRHAVSIYPTLTAAAQSSIATGSLPRRTGIVSNRFHLAKDSFYWYQDGFSMALADAEPVWKTAQRAGLRTAAVFFVGGQPDLPKQLADYTVGYGKRDIYSNQIKVAFTEAAAWENAPRSYSPARQGYVPLVSRGATIATLLLLATDTSDNGRADYDVFYLCEKPAITPACAALKSDGAFASFVVNSRIVSGADFKITNADLSRFTLFQSGVYYNTAAPAELVRGVNQKFGFFPPSPDYYALEHDWITAEDYLQMARRQSDYQMNVAIWVWQTYAPQLMFAYQPAIDEAQHQFLLVSPDQPGYTAAKAQTFEAYRRTAARIVDDNLGRLLAALDLNQTTLIVVSDHGMAPIKAEVNVNTLLQQAGLLKLYAGKTDVDVPNTEAIAFASGAAAHVYVNVKGREAAGIVAEKDAAAVVEKIAALLRGATDPKTRQPLFGRVVERAGLAELGLDSPASGDLYVEAAAGYTLTDGRGVAELVTPTAYYGQHGYDPNRPELRAIFVAAGRGIKPGAIEPVRLIDVAPTIARLLGFAPAASVDGRAIEPALK